MRSYQRKSRELLDKARESTLLAVDVYNRPTAVFRSSAYIVLMIIAWTALLHAVFHKRHISYYEKRGKGKGRFVYVDGEKKAWDVGRCASEYFKDPNDPSRKNLEFIIGIRNKIEHRSFPELDESIFGECQALLMNLEEVFQREFPREPSINQNLLFAIQFSKAQDSTQVKVLTQKTTRDLASIKKYIEQFRSQISIEQWNSQKYSFRLVLIPKVVNNQNKDDVAVEFVKYDHTKPEEMEKIQRIGVLIKDRSVEKLIPSQDMYPLKPGDVAKLVRDTTKKPFNITLHTRAWKYYKVRPSQSESDLSKCNTDYCLFDKAHGDYVYSRKWADFLITEFSDQSKYDKICKPQAEPKTK